MDWAGGMLMIPEETKFAVARLFTFIHCAGSGHADTMWFIKRVAVDHWGSCLEFNRHRAFRENPERERSRCMGSILQGIYRFPSLSCTTRIAWGRSESSVGGSEGGVIQRLFLKIAAVSESTLCPVAYSAVGISAVVCVSAGCTLSTQLALGWRDLGPPATSC